ncbi:MAG: hypothetical protein ACRDTC_23085 [Pseudonocardiaceae bacterium]
MMDLHSEIERYRTTIQLRTPGGERVTAIILRRGRGREGRVWFVFDGALTTTLVMDDHEADEVVGMIKSAQCAT